MKIAALTAIMMAAPGSAACAGLGVPSVSPKVAVCTNVMGGEGRAKTMTSAMFSRICVKLEWYLRECPPGALHVSLSTDTSPGLMPGALAYALPYEGTHIVVFWNRVQDTTDRSHWSQLLAHVFAHEITHILEGMNRHTGSGIMQAHWSASEIRNLAYRPLRFAPEDMDLIYRGIARHPVMPGPDQD